MSGLLHAHLGGVDLGEALRGEAPAVEPGAEGHGALLRRHLAEPKPRPRVHEGTPTRGRRNARGKAGWAGGFKVVGWLGGLVFNLIGGVLGGLWFG